VREPEVAQAEHAQGRGEARLLASGALVQQVAQVSGLLVLLVVVTVLARRLTVPELGAYGLTASLAGYLLVLRNSVAASAVRAMAGAVEPAGERARVFSAAVVLYVAVGVATGVLIAVVALVFSVTILDGALAVDARVGGAGLGALTAIGIAASVNLDALRAERRFVRAASLEIVAVALYLALMLGLIFGGADLAAVIAASGALPLLSGVLAAVALRRGGAAGEWAPLRFDRAGVTRERAMLIVPTAGWLLALELSNLVMYAFDRVLLGAFGSARTVGLYEGPVRAHNLLYALNGALAVPTVPTASRYVATGDERRLRELALRGSRYTLALIVPLVVTLMALAEPLLGVWLGDRYTGGATALTILVSYWLLYGALVVTPGFLVGAGRAREAAQIVMCAAAANLALSLALTPWLGLEGPAVGTAVPFVVAYPLLLRVGLGASGASAGDLARQALLPAYVLGAALAAALVVVRVALDPDTLVAVLGLGAAGVLAYWGAFYGVVLGRDERMLMHSLLTR
jgi:O-antigen/teichoic acid export membrane protein